MPSFQPRRAAWPLVVLAALAAAPVSSALAGGEKTRVIVAFKPGGQAAVRQAVVAARGSIELEITGMPAFAVSVPPQAIAGLSRNPNVDYVEDDVVRYPFATSTPSTGQPYAPGQQVPYGIAMVQADLYAADPINSDLSTRKVCIIDSGYARGHEDLSAGANVTGEYDSGTGWWHTDENGHGTHVAGTISALNATGIGVVGVSANATLKLHIVKVFGADGWAYSSTLASAANKCKAAGANIVSMSLGGSRSSKTEQRAFDSLYSGGILSVAAAGNAGTSANSYPASYASVVSVAAIDANRAWASFSQYNAQVEIAAPGVDVLSTVPPGSGTASALSVGNTVYAPGGIDGSPRASATGALADFGLGDTAVAGSMTGRVCLIQRGNVDFATKVRNCQDSGGAGAVIYNNVAGGFGGTLGTTVTAIPSVTASDTEGMTLKQQLGQSAKVSVTGADYARFDGTSMATPHVAAVAALVWRLHPQCTAAQLRASLNKSAVDLGAPGRDTRYGHGLVQAQAADKRIQSMGCGK